VSFVPSVDIYFIGYLNYFFFYIFFFLLFFFSCVPAQPTVNASLVKTMCRPYNYYKNDYCRNILGDRKMYGTELDQDKSHSSFRNIVHGKRLLEKYRKIRVPDFCMKVWNDSLCQAEYPKCDETSGTLRPKPVCRETCENVDKLCEKEIKILMKFNKVRVSQSSPNQYPLYWSLHNCSLLQFRNGGDTPECYYYRLLNSKSINVYELDQYIF
jgi:hypothetical protein